MSRVEKVLPPILLLADSQLLFLPGEENSLLSRLVRHFGIFPGSIRAAYLGASNGDKPEFYEIFVAAMAREGIVDCRHISAQPSATCVDFLDSAQLILLAGGDVERGWRLMQQAGLIEKILACHQRGAALVGISAGAVQLGLTVQRVLVEPGSERKLPPFLSLVPLIVDVHDEPHWTRLKGSVHGQSGSCAGLGIPTGSGLWVHSNGKQEPIGRAACECIEKNE